MGNVNEVRQVIEVHDQGQVVAFSFQDMLRYSGPGSPGGVALGFKLMEMAFGLLEPDGWVERREVIVNSAFRGPGVRDACELVTRGLTDGRYIVNPALARPERGHSLSTFAFRVGYRGRNLSILVAEGVITDEFVRLAQSPNLTAEEDVRFTSLKQAVADQVMSRPASESFIVE